MEGNSKRTESLRRQALELRHQFAQGNRGMFAGVLPVEEVAKLIERECGGFRERVYPPLTTLRLFIEQVIADDRACQDVVCRHLSERVAQRKAMSSLNTGAYCQARQRLPLSVPQQLYRTVAATLESRMPKAWRWRGRCVKLFDGTAVSMPDTEENQREFPQSSEQKAGLGFPLARICGLVSLASGAVLGHAVAACKGKGSGEQSLLLTDLLPLLEAGDILLADALLATWWIVAEAQATGVDIVMPQHARRITDFSQGCALGKQDHVVDWPKPQRPAWMSVERWERYPAALTIREFEVDGRTLVTTLLDREQVSPRELDALYALRWSIEVDWRTIKATLEMDVLRCLSPAMVRKEIAVYLLAYNLVRWTMATAAKLADLLPRALGFTGAKRILLAFVDELRHAGKRRLSFMFTTVLGAIAAMKLPVRPGRIEPRAKKRRPKPLPLLTVPRQTARENITAARHARGLS